MSKTIFGLDEAGRGAFAGPLVAAAVCLTISKNQIESKANAPIRDSKKLTKFQRERIFNTVISLNLPTHISTISAREINSRGLGWANKQIFLNLISKLKADHFIIDGNLKISEPDKHIESIPKADSLYPQVSLASIVAKVTRDAYMTNLHQDFPQYCWHQNAGYGTLVHRQALAKHGPCLHHRTLFVKNSLKNL